MPEKETLERAERDREEGKSPSTQAGEFVREEMHHIREGKHGAASSKQAIAIGLSKARRAGVNLPPPPKGKTSEKTRRSAASAYRKGRRGAPISRTRSQARSKALRREGRAAASHRALSRQARSAARRRSSASRSATARKTGTDESAAVGVKLVRHAARCKPMSDDVIALPRAAHRWGRNLCWHRSPYR